MSAKSIRKRERIKLLSLYTRHVRLLFVISIIATLLLVSGASATNGIWIVPDSSGGDVISVWKGVSTPFDIATVTRDGENIISIEKSIAPSEVVWKSANPSTGDFNAEGIFIAKSDGETEITATYNGWTDSKTVCVTSSPSGAIYLNPVTATVGDTVHFLFAAYDTNSGRRLTNSELGTQWSVADSGAGSFANPSIGDYTAPKTAGTYILTAQGTNPGYTSYYATATVNVVLPPAPGYTIDGPSSGYVGNTLSFTPVYSSGSRADAFSWSVHKVGQPNVSSSSRVLDHTFTSAGDYVIRLTVTNTAYGLSSSATELVVRISSAPIVPTTIPTTPTPTRPASDDPIDDPTVPTIPVSPTPTNSSGTETPLPTTTPKYYYSSGGYYYSGGSGSINTTDPDNLTKDNETGNQTLVPSPPKWPFWCDYCWWFFAAGLVLGCLVTLLVEFIIWKRRSATTGTVPGKKEL